MKTTLLALSATALLLSACGGMSGSPQTASAGTTATGTTATTTPAKPAPTAIERAQGRRSMENAGPYRW